MQLVTSANSVWPSTATPSVAYAQVGDLVEMLLHPKGSAFSTCGFCQTLNREGANRCRACGGSFLASEDEEEPDADDEDATQQEAAAGGPSLRRREFSDLPALRTVLLLVLVPPLLMFLGFGAWNELRASLAGPEQVVLPSRSSIDSVFAVSSVAVPVSRVAQVAVAPAKSVAPVHAASDGSDAHAAGPAATVAAAVESERDVQKSAPARAARTASSPQAARVPLGNPIAECSGYSFIARAVCVNRNCADPRAAQHAQCKQANRQRRIDESRRNPVLMG